MPSFKFAHAEHTPLLGTQTGLKVLTESCKERSLSRSFVTLLGLS